MGNCLSSFRAQFRPNRPSEGTATLPLTPPKPIPTKPKDDEKPPIPDKPAVDGDDFNEILGVQDVDIMSSENANRHYTDKFTARPNSKPKLIVRRGFPFKLRLKLSRNCDWKKDGIVLVFTAKDAPNPSYSQGTMILCPVLRPDDESLPSEGWRSKFIEKEDKAVVVEVISPPNSIVGEWSLVVDSQFRGDRTRIQKHSCDKSLFLLFNPWCNGDTVFMEDMDQSREYVLNDMGMIWRGTHSSLRPCVWNFGQFEDDVLECCIYLLTGVGKLNVVDRANPVKVSRHISAVINSPNDRGVLEGNWTGEYKGGTSPTQWAGSFKILQQFYKSKKPVKFGQCWVFSGVCTTVARCLGIPSRSVTNFCSAHDTHNSLTIDAFYDREGEPIDRLNIDSIWNFHVWNEVWMERPDLEPGGYGGWQAIDATPQEQSDGQYRCGPASLAAIKRGEVEKPFDTQFLFAEVNADNVYWKYHGSGSPLKLIQKDSNKIGQFISTKELGTSRRQDITQDYKFEEGTDKEREIMLRALRQCENAFSRYYLNEDFEDIKFDFLLLDDIVIGAPFMVILKIKNRSKAKKNYTVDALLRVDSMLYTGELKKLVKKEKYEVKVASGKEEAIKLKVSYEDYERAIVDQAAFNIATMATVQETGFDYFAQDDFRVRMPDIFIETEGELVEGKEFTVTVRLINPLPKSLTKGVFSLEGPGLGEPLKLKVKGEVKAGEEAIATCKMTPKKGGERSIAAKFESKELKDVDGMTTIFVTPLEAQPET